MKRTILALALRSVERFEWRSNVHWTASSSPPYATHITHHNKILSSRIWKICETPILKGVSVMDEVTRRTLLAATAAGGIFAAATAAGAQTSEPVPQPLGPGRGGTDPGPRNLARDGQNSDLLVPPSTDSGTLPNLRFSFADAHMRLTSGGWTRQATVREFGLSKSLAGVNMRLNAGGIREMHWHKAAEWAFMLSGG